MSYALASPKGSWTQPALWRPSGKGSFHSSYSLFLVDQAGLLMAEMWQLWCESYQGCREGKSWTAINFPSTAWALGDQELGRGWVCLGRIYATGRGHDTLLIPEGWIPPSSMVSRLRVHGTGSLLWWFWDKKIPLCCVLLSCPNISSVMLIQGLQPESTPD